MLHKDRYHEADDRPTWIDICLGDFSSSTWLRAVNETVVAWMHDDACICRAASEQLLPCQSTCDTEMYNISSVYSRLGVEL